MVCTFSKRQYNNKDFEIFADLSCGVFTNFNSRIKARLISMRKNGSERTFIGRETETNVGHLLRFKRCLPAKGFGKNRTQTERNYHAISEGKIQNPD